MLIHLIHFVKIFETFYNIYYTSMPININVCVCLLLKAMADWLDNYYTFTQALTLNRFFLCVCCRRKHYTHNVYTV